MAQVSAATRATLRGAAEGLGDHRVVGGEGGGDGNGGDGGWRLELQGAGRARLVPSNGDRPVRVLLLPAGQGTTGSSRRTEVVVNGWRFEVDVEPEQRAALRERARRARDDAGHSGPVEVHAIIPGVVVSIGIAPGDTVEAGQQLLVIEAMKMQNELRAPRAGRVERVLVGERSKIEVGDLLVVIE